MRNVILEMEQELYEEVRATAGREGVTMAGMLRRIFQAAAINIAGEEAKGIVRLAVAAEVKSASEAMEKRIKKILSKTTRAAYTAAHLSAECIIVANKRCATEMRRLARAKAVEYLKVEDDGEEV